MVLGMKIMNYTKHVVCFSGGESSALVGVEVARRFGAENTILLNHDINPNVESADIKRFKAQVSKYVGIPITFANIKGMEGENIPDQFDVTVDTQAFKVGNGSELCTSRLKTEPFMSWLKEMFPEKNCIIYYGFDANETKRIQRRAGIMGAQGYRTDYPLALWQDRTIRSVAEIGIDGPGQYEIFKHANCIGCLKAGKQHWYIVYCTRQDIWEKAKWAEDEIGYSIISGVYLEELEPIFEEMKRADIPCTEHIPHQTFWAAVRRAGIDTSPDSDRKPCECLF